MKAIVPWRCRVLKLIGLHGNVWRRKDATPSGHRSCKGCGLMYR